MKMHNNYALEHNKGIFVHLPMLAEYLRLVPSLKTIADDVDAKNIVDMNFTDTETTVTYLDQHKQEHTKVIARYPLVEDDAGKQQFHIKVENPTDKILRITLSDFDDKNPEVYEIDTTELYERLTKLERIITVGFEGEQEPNAYTTFADLTKRGTSEFARVQVANATSDSPFDNNEPMYGYVYRQSPVGTGYIYIVETATQGSTPRVAFGSFSISPEGEPILQWNTVGLPREVKEELQNHEDRITKLEQNGSSKLTYSGKDASGGLYDVDSVYFDNNMRQLTVASHDPNNPEQAIQSSMKLDDLINAVDGAQLSELDLTTQDKVLSIQGFDNTEQRNPLPIINVPLDGKVTLTTSLTHSTLSGSNITATGFDIAYDTLNYTTGLDDFSQVLGVADNKGVPNTTGTFTTKAETPAGLFGQLSLAIPHPTGDINIPIVKSDGAGTVYILKAIHGVKGSAYNVFTDQTIPAGTYKYWFD